MTISNIVVAADLTPGVLKTVVKNVLTGLGSIAPKVVDFSRTPARYVATIKVSDTSKLPALLKAAGFNRIKVPIKIIERTGTSMGVQIKWTKFDEASGLFLVMWPYGPKVLHLDLNQE